MQFSITTIEIGASVHCNGQFLVTSNLLGLSEKQLPFAKVYTNLRKIITGAITKYTTEVSLRFVGNSWFFHYIQLSKLAFFFFSSIIRLNNSNCSCSSCLFLGG